MTSEKIQSMKKIKKNKNKNNIVFDLIVGILFFSLQFHSVQYFLNIFIIIVRWDGFVRCMSVLRASIEWKRLFPHLCLLQHLSILIIYLFVCAFPEGILNVADARCGWGASSHIILFSIDNIFIMLFFALGLVWFVARRGTMFISSTWNR